MKKIILIPVIASLFASLGCDPKKDLAAFQNGDYDGFIIKKTDDSKTQNFVTAKMKSPRDMEYVINVTESADDSSPASWTIDITIESRNSISISIPSMAPNPIELYDVKNSCFESRETLNWARLCYSHQEASLDFKNKTNDFTLLLDPAKSKNIPVPETPQAYSKNQLLNRAINRSFTSRIEYERVIQAHLTAKNNFKNLLPHFTINTMLAFLPVSYQSLLRDIGDLAPFLLPNRWYKAKSAQLTYNAEFDGWITMKADAANVVEGLALSILQTRQTLEKLESNKKIITGLRDQIQSRETTGILQIGSSDDITAVINQVDQTIETLQESQANEYASLAQASGFVSANAISELILTTDDSVIDNPTPFDPEQVTKIALNRSYELRQIDYLYQAAGKDEARSKFEWIDPSGILDGALGFGLKDYINTAESRKNQILIKRQQVQSIISEELKHTFNEIADAEKQRALAIEGRNIQDRRIARITTNMQLGISYALADLVTALQGRVDNDIKITQAGYQYLMAWSRLNRLLYAGPYANLARGDMLTPAFDAEIAPVSE